MVASDTSRYKDHLGVGQIAAIGELLLEFLPASPEVLLGTMGTLCKSPSGAAGIFAVAVASLGGPSALIAKVGTDDFSQLVTRVVASYGVDLSRVKTDATGQLGLCFPEESAGGRRFIYYRKDSVGSRLSPDDLDPTWLASCWGVHFPAMLLGVSDSMRDLCLKVSELAGESGCSFKLSIDPNLRRELMKDDFLQLLMGCIRKAYVITPSLEEAQLLADCHAPEDALVQLMEMGPSVVAVTMGQDGVLVGWNDVENPETRQIRHIPGLTVEAIDTVGAGDTFAAALLVGLREGMAPPDAAYFANKAAALKVTKMGAIGAGIPSRQEVDQWV